MVVNGDFRGEREGWEGNLFEKGKKSWFFVDFHWLFTTFFSSPIFSHPIDFLRIFDPFIHPTYQQACCASTHVFVIIQPSIIRSQKQKTKTKKNPSS